MGKILQDNFPFIQQMIADAFHIESQYFTYPYQGIERIDKGIRKMMWTTYDVPDIHPAFMNEKISYRILVIKSTLKFYNILIIASLDERPDLINVGPFRNEEISMAFFEKFFRNTNISKDKLSLMKEYYHALPLFAVNDVTLFLNHLLSHFVPAFASIEAELINYSDIQHKIILNEDEMTHQMFQFGEDYRKILIPYLDEVAAGNYPMAREQLHNLTRLIHLERQSDLSALRQTVSNLNTYCEVRLMQTSVHPMYIMRLFHAYTTLITTTVNRQKLLDLPLEMTRKYCLLVRNYSFPGYSKLIRDVIAYIDENLSSELSLSSIAEHFNKNASFLSKQFGKETGQSLTSYIRSCRMKLAIQYLNTTELSISEIAGLVGIHDYSYFTKQFRKEIGVTPIEYRTMLR